MVSPLPREEPPLHKVFSTILQDNFREESTSGLYGPLKVGAEGTPREQGDTHTPLRQREVPDLPFHFLFLFYFFPPNLCFSDSSHYI